MIRLAEPNSTDSHASGKGYNLLTLDVFDTCLIRDFVSQESLWRLLGREAGKRLPGVPGAAQFARLRAEAEDYARKTSPAEDITLAQVYDRLASVCGWNPRQQEQAATLEEEFEARGLSVNPAARSFLASIEQAVICYLTDTPHRGSFIGDCLDRLQLPPGPVFSSGDTGKRKGTGSLFREVMTRLEMDRGEILHVGNDLRSDGAGSAVAKVAFGPLLAANPNRYESTLDAATTGPAGLLGACLAGAGRIMRLEESGRFPAALTPVVTGVAGPAIFAAAAWALLSAQADGVDTLYFVSRDGEILLAAAELIQRELGLVPGIACRYLHGSRRAWHLPALSLRDGPDFVAALHSLLARPGPATARGLLARLDLGRDDMVRAMAEAMPGSSLDTPLGDRREEVVQALAASALVQALARSQAAAAYEATVGYLRQSGLLGGQQVGLVDVGWLGHASASLAAVAADQGTQVRCYFAGGLCGRGSQGAPQGSRAFLIDARGEESELRPALVHLMESFCAGSGDSVIGYAQAGDGWRPRFDDASGHATARWGLAGYQALIRSYVQAACQAVRKAEADMSLPELAALRPALIANLRALWRTPSYAEAEFWGSFPFEGDCGLTSLAQPVSRIELLSYVRHFARPAAWPRFGPWRQAVLVRTVGGGRFPDPFGLLQVLSPSRRPTLRAKVRARLARQVKIHISDVTPGKTGLTVRPRR
jgi:FMN phosphatase YigB (HAD superfamily)